MLAAAAVLIALAATGGVVVCPVASNRPWPRTGPDVAELNADLVALGYDTRAQLSPKSASFGPATTPAVDELQASLG